MISQPFNDGAKAVAPGPEAIDGHVSQKVRQLFRIERTRELRHPQLKLECVEWILKDQFGNEYFLHRAMLFDGEMYDVAQWFWCGGVERRGLVGDFKRFGTVSDALMDHARDTAFMAFARTNLAILAARKQSGTPQAIEAKDMTAQANRLARAMIAAGKEVQAGPKDPMPLLKIDPAVAKSVQARADGKLPPLTDGKLFSFPTTYNPIQHEQPPPQ